jgi:hypothetical protein
MAIYGVIMDQGVAVPNLNGNVLITGWGNPEDSIQSCSAVIMVNTATGAAGLYHFPAGDISGNHRAQTLLTEMRDDVDPTEAYIVYGIERMGFGANPITPVDPYHSDLRDFVLRLLPVTARLRRQPARTRIASVTIAGGAVVIGDQTPGGGIIDLRTRVAGVYGFGHVYWSR